MVNIAIFASGEGTNAQHITEQLNGSGSANVALIVASRLDAKVLERAKRLHIPAVVLTKTDMDDGQNVLTLLRKYGIRMIVLAGYLLHIPAYLIEHFPRAIVNIHPALLPKHGGKGMYGLRVHQDVIDCGDLFSGITVHYVSSEYDSGEIIMQAKCAVEQTDTASSLACKVHQLEYAYYPVAIELLAKALQNARQE